MNIFPSKWCRLRHLCDASGRFKVLAMDQTGQTVSPIKQKRGLNAAPCSNVSAAEGLVAKYLTPKFPPTKFGRTREVTADEHSAG